MEDVQVVAMLVRRCLAGDAAAWEEIVQTYNRRIYNICYRFAGSSDDAEDLAQEVFIKMYRTLASYDSSKGAFVTWVTTITRNLLGRSLPQNQAGPHYRLARRHFLRSRRRPAPERANSGPIRASRPARSQPGGAETVHAALARLSPELREAVILRDLQDFDYREIATVLKVPEGTVKSRINRGRAELARLLQRTYRQVM